ncbi:hypothetical protein SM033_00067 [Vibrio phage vB_VpaM_sm033]|nr:hypothetical protein SM033_00067 [Vibrio phage vB_VpaM_sm033]
MIQVSNTWRRMRVDCAILITDKNMCYVEWVAENREEANRVSAKLMLGKPCKRNPQHNYFHEVKDGEVIRREGTIRYIKGTSNCVHCKRDAGVERNRKRFAAEQKSNGAAGEARRRAEAIREARELGLNVEDIL